MDPLLWILGSVFTVSLVSVIVIVLLFWRSPILQKYLLFFVSFAAGTLLGDVFLHLIPEAIEGSTESLRSFGIFFCVGFFIFLLIEKTMHWHHHSGTPVGEEMHQHSLGFMNLLGDGIHNLLDGMIIAGAYLVSFPAGVATTLAVIFHEIPQEIGDFGILLYSGFSKKKALLFNFVTALSAVLGALITFFLFEKMGMVQTFLLPIAAGGMLYIAAADLIPETKKETKPSAIFAHTLLMALGVLVMFFLTFLE